MTITNERVELLAKTLMNDATFANEIIEMSADEAAEALKAKGFDFTAEELSAFAEDLFAFVSENDQLGEADLDDVSGGCYVHPHRRPPYRRYTHYHYGPYCIIIKNKRYCW